MRDFLRVRDFDRLELEKLVSDSISVQKEGRPGERYLERKSLGLLFEKSSTRTRVSMETAMTELGGHCQYLSKEHLQLSRGESIGITARVLSSYLHGVAIRTYEHQILENFSRSSSIPIINALSDEAHPCQTIADLMTLKEIAGDLKNLKVAWVGDGNNVANSFVEGCALLEADIGIATPVGYEIDQNSLDFAKKITDVEVTNDPKIAVEGADAVYTDVWISMGNEDEEEKRLKDFKGFKLTRNLLEKSEDAYIMHCMPIQGPEIAEELIDSENSLIFRQAANRLHASKAIFKELLK